MNSNKKGFQESCIKMVRFKSKNRGGANLWAAVEQFTKPFTRLKSNSKYVIRCGEKLADTIALRNDDLTICEVEIYG